MTTAAKQETKTRTGAEIPALEQEHDVRTALWAQAMIREHQAEQVGDVFTFALPDQEGSRA